MNSYDMDIARLEAQGSAIFVVTSIEPSNLRSREKSAMAISRLSLGFTNENQNNLCQGRQSCD
jgi:hypothetical protein